MSVRALLHVAAVGSLALACGYSAEGEGSENEGGAAGVSSGGTAGAGAAGGAASGAGGMSGAAGSLSAGGTSSGGSAGASAGAGGVAGVSGSAASGASGDGASGASSGGDGGIAAGGMSGGAAGSGGAQGGTAGAGEGGSLSGAGGGAGADSGGMSGTAGGAGMAGGGAAGTGNDGCPASGNVSYTLTTVQSPTADQAEAYELITAAMDKALEYYNCYTNIEKALTVQYNPSVATADGNSNGNIRFGGKQYMEYSRAMHEIAHTVGIGTYQEFHALVVDGIFTGEAATAQVRLNTGNPDELVHADSQHFWPGGLNYASEAGSEKDVIDHCLMVVAIRKDMGFGL